MMFTDSPSCEEGVISVKEWFSSSPLEEFELHEGDMSMEEYWAQMTLSYAENENGSLDEDGDEEDEDSSDNEIDFGDEFVMQPHNGAILSLATGISDDEDEEEEEETSSRDDKSDYCDDNSSGHEYDDDGGHEGLFDKYMTSPRPTDASINKSTRDEQNFFGQGIENDDSDEDGVTADLLGVLGDGAQSQHDQTSTPMSEHSHKSSPQKSLSIAQNNGNNSKSNPYEDQKRPVAQSRGKNGVTERKSERKALVKRHRAAHDAEKKHKMWLLEMVEKKRQEEAELMDKVRKAELKRKKFKEALLERARAKQQAQQEVDNQAHEQEVSKPTKKKVKRQPAVDSSCAVPGKKKDDGGVEDGDEEALLKEEEEARKQMEEAIRIRKKFKRQQKKILQSLKQKKIEEEKKIMEAMENDERVKERLRKRNEKLLRKREVKVGTKPGGEGEEGQDWAAGSGVSAVRASRSQGDPAVPITATESESSHPERVGKVTRRSRSVSAADRSAGATESSCGEESAKPRKPRKMASSSMADEICREGAQEDDGKDENADEVAAKERRKLEAKRRQEKVAAQLKALSEQRQMAALKAKRQEDRAKKRADLLSARVQMEFSERKLMAKEDKYANPGCLGEIMLTKPEATDAEAPKKKVTPEMAEAMFNRLQARQAKSKECADARANSMPQARDFADWKKKNAVPSDAKVFCMTGWYPCVKSALLQRGWYFNPDHTSPYCDLKWTLRSSDVTAETLQPWQLTNHFMKNIALTTKIGLLKSLQQLVWIADATANDIIPRGYDLTNAIEIQEYIDDFRIQQAECILKKLYHTATGLDKPKSFKKHVPMTPRTSPREAEGGNGSQTPQRKDEDVEIIAEVPEPIVDVNKLLVNRAVFSACCAILERFLKPYYSDCIDNEPQYDDNYAVSALEWELISEYDISSTHILPENAPEPIDDFIQDKNDGTDPGSPLNTAKQRQAVALANRNSRLQKKHEMKARQEASNHIKELVPLGEDGLRTVHELLSKCNIINYNQTSLNGKGASAMNMWIVKPAAKSRGRGITTFCDLKKLLDYVELGRSGKSCLTSSHWIVQKYMENSMIIANRKFDLRQWVLVYDWNPLTIYFFDEFYARFSVDEYSTSEETMDNAHVHLVNNSIGKTSEKYHEKCVTDNGEVLDGFMLSHEQFCSYLEFKSGDPGIVSNLKSRMKDMAVWSLMCGSDAIEHRKNSWELYGFDFMVDDEFNPWLIEINSSPACDYSTKVTERYVQKALVELLSVVLDVREWENTPKKVRGEKPDTGGWECIYTGPYLETPASSFGTDMSVKGEAMKVPRKKAPMYTTTLFSGKQLGSSPPREKKEAGYSKAVESKKSIPSECTSKRAASTSNTFVKYDPNECSDSEEESGSPGPVRLKPSPERARNSTASKSGKRPEHLPRASEKSLSGSRNAERGDTVHSSILPPSQVRAAALSTIGGETEVEPVRSVNSTRGSFVSSRGTDSGTVAMLNDSDSDDEGQPVGAAKIAPETATVAAVTQPKKMSIKSRAKSGVASDSCSNNASGAPIPIKTLTLDF
mmetsp:Transcript_5079/g.7763  ORF Transcript_5079/g.7763 Transcript_5079/m.7763 type:complete len:1548 (-) Transcript_5079:76-4719(-)